MNIMAQLALLFGVCLAGEGISALLPVAFPASVISMILLMILLLSGVVKPRHIQRVSDFLMANMAFVFLPPCVGAMEHAEAILGQLFPILAICLLTTPLVYLVTAWTVQGTLALMRRREGKSHV